MFNPLKPFGSLFKRFGHLLKKFAHLFTKENIARIETALERVDAYVPKAFEIVAMLAVKTPTRKDDELIAIAKEFAYGPIDLKVTSKEDVLRNIARFVLRKEVRDKITDSIANAAIEKAVIILKGTQVQ